MLDIILGIITIFLIFLSYYIAIKSKIKAEAEHAINVAENLAQIGKDKMKIAIAKIEKMIPVFLKPIFSEAVIEKIVQKVFDEMEEYAKNQLLKKGGK